VESPLKTVTGVKTIGDDSVPKSCMNALPELYSTWNNLKKHSPIEVESAIYG